MCETNKCHKDKEFGCNLHGLIRHLVYKVSGEVLDWRPAWAFAQQNIDRLKEHLAGRVRQTSTGGHRRVVHWTRDDLLGCLEVPSRYYLGRGYRAETLQHFGVGTCVRPLPDGKRLLDWAVFPIWDAPHQPQPDPNEPEPAEPDVVSYVTAKLVPESINTEVVSWGVPFQEAIFMAWDCQAGSLIGPVTPLMVAEALVNVTLPKFARLAKLFPRLGVSTIHPAELN